MTPRFIIALLAFNLLLSSAIADPEPPTMNASELAGRLRAKQEGSALIRVRMEISGAQKNVLQLQIKSRISKGSADVLYQVLFPKERKGESVLLRRSGGQMSGTVFAPPESLRTLNAEQMKEPLLGSELSCEDVIDDFLAWERQEIVGTDVIDRMSCQILESKPGRGNRSSYGSVRTWVDARRLVPLRIEKFGKGGELIRRITVTRVLLDGGDSIPVNLSVRGPGGTVTEIDGSRIKRGVTFSEDNFSPDALKKPVISREATE